MGHSSQQLRLRLWNNLNLRLQPETRAAGYVIRTVSPVRSLLCCLIVRSVSVLVSGCLVGVLIFIPAAGPGAEHRSGF